MKRSEVLDELEMLIVDKLDIHSKSAWLLGADVLDLLEELGMLPPPIKDSKAVDKIDDDFITLQVNYYHNFDEESGDMITFWEKEDGN